ncbi:MAG: hypothetical protein AB7P33_02615 [Dehalococcoidia bacterium]
MESRPCPLCSSSDVTWRRRRPTDVLATWVRYGTDFVFGATLKGGQFKKAGGLATYTYKDTKTFDAPNRADVGDSFHYSNTTHQVLATPRWYWRCPNCGNKGEVYDESVLREDQS